MMVPIEILILLTAVFFLTIILLILEVRHLTKKIRILTELKDTSEAIIKNQKHRIEVLEILWEIAKRKREENA